MKKAKWLILVFMLFCVVCLSACSITWEDIELFVRVNSDLKATATVTLSNINLNDFVHGAHLDRIDIYYAYSDEKKTSLASYREINFSASESGVPDDAGDGRFSFEITDEENDAFLESGNNYREKQVEFRLPADASGKDVDYLVALIGSDIDTYMNSRLVTSTVSSRIFTFKAVQPMYTVTIPAAVSLGQTAALPSVLKPPLLCSIGQLFRYNDLQYFGRVILRSDPDEKKYFGFVCACAARTDFDNGFCRKHHAGHYRQLRHDKRKL